MAWKDLVKVKKHHLKIRRIFVMMFFLADKISRKIEVSEGL